jgi:large repetitive protein
LPRNAAGPATAPDSAIGVTDGAGFVTFQWTPTNPDGISRFQVSEGTVTNPPNPPGGNYENAPSETVCSSRTPDTPGGPLDIDTVDPAGGFTIDIVPESIVTCTLVNIAEPDPSMTVEKYTNGVDADEPPGPMILAGSPVVWTYVVTNTGNTTLTDLAVVDSDIGAINCPTTTVPIDGTVTCTAPQGVAQAGQYANIATATAVDTNGIEVDDTDPSHYFGGVPGISVKKFTNGQDADTPTGPLVAAGAPVTWTYQVTLTPGNLPLGNVTLIDDAGTPSDPSDDFAPTLTGGDAGVIGLLEAGETWTYQAVGVAQEGQYANFATVSGDQDGPGGAVPVTDNDPSHYFGVMSEVDIEKYTNGFDADELTDPDVPLLRVGSPVQWTYVVTNLGNAPLVNWSVTDDIVGEVDRPTACARLILAPGASTTCHLSGTAEEGEYTNLGTVEATDLLGNTLSDSDPSNYIGVLPSIDIEKLTNGDDADTPPGPLVPFPSTVDWDYLVTNTGSAVLTDLVVVDPRLSGLAPLTCLVDELEPDESTTCSESGPAVVGRYRNMAIAQAIDPFGELVSDSDPSHYFGVEGGITLEKHTNGVDSDLAPGVLIPEGDPVEWTFLVFNTGNSALSEIVLVDDQLGSIACPSSTLAVGASMTCTANGTAIRGQYANTATVSGIDAVEQEVSDTDPSHYFGYLLQIDVEKATNGEDADDPTGPYISAGDPVTWTYEVTNPGDFSIAEVVLTDDQGVTPVFKDGDADGDTFLDPGEVWSYEATGTALPGQYANVATVTGTPVPEFEGVLTDTDPSHYFGLAASIDIVKSPDVAVVAIGQPHTFTITVTNTSNVDLTDVVVTDPVTPACDQTIGPMTPGQVVTYTCDVSEVFTHISNIASVQGVAPDGTVVTDEDPAEVTVIGAGGISAIGDLVWFDNNQNGIQDSGEAGITGARVTLALDTESVEVIPLEIVTVTVTTDATGHYLVEGLVPGEYTVTLDQSSVAGTLTTPADYQVSLGLGVVYLDADFGLAQVAPGQGGGLPFTGAWGIPELAILAAILILTGGAFLLRGRFRKPGIAELP